MCRYISASFLAFVTLCSSASASLIQFQPPGKQGNTFFLQVWDWDVTNVAPNPGVQNGPNWLVEVESAGPVGGVRSLELRAAHLPDPPHVGDIARNPQAGTNSVTLGNIVRGAAGVPFRDAKGAQ